MIRIRLEGKNANEIYKETLHFTVLDIKDKIESLERCISGSTLCLTTDWYIKEDRRNRKYIKRFKEVLKRRQETKEHQDNKALEQLNNAEPIQKNK